MIKLALEERPGIWRKTKMEREKINTILAISSGLLSAAGLVLILVSIFGETKDNWALAMAFLAIILANIFNFVRARNTRGHSE